MKILKYCSAILLLLICTTFSLQAQDTILNRSVSVQREYRPVIHDAGKINSMPQVLEPNEDKSPAVYSNFNLPLNAGYNIHVLPAADLVTEKQVDPNKGFARFGFGNYLNTLADFAYPLVNTPDLKLDFSLNHLATFEAKRMHTTTKANLSFDKLFKTFDLYAGVGGGHEYFKYYGNNVNAANSPVNLDSMATAYPLAMYAEKNRQGVDYTPRLYNLNALAKDSFGDTFWRFNAVAGVRSLTMSDDWRYQAEMQYRVFSSHNGMAENLVHSQAGLNSQNGKNRMGLDFAMDNMMYTSKNMPDFNYWKSYTVLSLNPYYSIERPSYNVRLGMKLNLSFVHGKLISPVADVRGEWKLIPKFLSIYGGLSGDYEVNTLDKINTENPYVFSDLRVLDTYTPVDFYAGIKLKPLYNLLIDGYIDYKQIDNQYFFVNKEYDLAIPQYLVPEAPQYLYTNRFNVTYGTASHLKMGIRANYNLKKLVNVELKWAYNGWSVNNQQYAWNKPKYDAQLNTDIHINPNLWVSANMYYEGVRYAKLGDVAMPMHDKVDINLGINYSYTNWLTVFGKINNVINNRYQDFYGYDVQGTNMMIGAAFSF
ncbi:MAG: hypothetical protein PHT07_01250 [Paludibacter sp.]|nr:hypothetical protein [Paludibacter sp.]